MPNVSTPSAVDELRALRVKITALRLQASANSNKAPQQSPEAVYWHGTASALRVVSDLIGTQLMELDGRVLDA